ncbi:MAG: 2OG-Fe(II) oxygenase [Pseudomonadota bacterium]
MVGELVVFPGVMGTCYHVPDFAVPEPQCEAIIDDVLRFVTFNRSGAFQTDRHVRYPTTDIDVIKVLDNARGLELTTLVLPLLDEMRRRYRIPENLELVLSDFFFAKYEPAAQNDLRRHTDGTLLSFVVGLSDPEDFVGGTLLLGEDQCGARRHELRLPRGHAVIFPGGVVAHRVTPVLAGQRFVLTGFVEPRHAQVVPSIIVKEWCNRFQAQCQRRHEEGQSCEDLVAAIPGELERIAARLPPRRA